MNIFVDSDVIISSLLSQKGASYQLFHTPKKECTFFISNFSLKELRVVINRLHITEHNLNHLIDNHLKVVELSQSLESLKNTYSQYVKDIHDAHIIAAAHISKAHFLITYNQKDFEIDTIKKDLNSIIVLTPGMFLQYLRSN